MPKAGVFSGSTRECLIHYGNNLPGKGGKRSPEARQPMADFVGCDNYLIYRWFNSEHMPIGENLLRVMAWLYTQNYKLTEWEKLPKLAQQLILILAHKLRSFDQMQGDLRYRSRDSLLSVLRGANMAPAKIRAAHALIARFPINTEATKAEIVELKQTTGSVDHRVIIDSLGHHIDAMLPLAQLVLSEEFSVEERRRLREQVSDDGLLTLAQVLNGLCSARSRELVLQKLSNSQEGR